jgi:hypothetical protein
VWYYRQGDNEIAKGETIMQEVMLRWHSLVSAFVKYFQTEIATEIAQEQLPPIRVYDDPKEIYLA